jgi:ketol-acid reductoisomerase
MFEVLVEAKCDPEVVVMELYGSGEMSELYAAARDMGLWGQIRLHSRTSQYGQQVIAKRFLDLEADRARLRRIVEYVQSGEFPKEWQAEQEAGLPNLLKVTNENLRHPMQIAENRLYRVLGRRDRDLVEAEWLLE